MGPKKSNKNIYIFYASVAILFAFFLSCHMGKYQHLYPTAELGQIISGGFQRLTSTPFDLFPWYWYSIKTFLTIVTVGGFAALALYVNGERNRVTMPGKESGSAKWNSDIKKYNQKYVDTPKEKNMILSQDVFLSMNNKKTRFNNNVLVIGGSGSGKSRFFVKPNLLQGNCNYIVTDPAGELLASTGKFLKEEGYDIIVFNLVEMVKSNCYNPFHYIRSDEEVLTMIDCLITNTTPPNSKGGDQFWVKSEQALLQALCFYLRETEPPEKQNFNEVLRLLNLAEVDEQNAKAESPLDKRFNKLKEHSPNSMAVKSYAIFKMGAGKTLKSILISCGVRIQVFNLVAVKNLTSIDNIHLEEMGTGKKALFVITPQASQTYNFLVSMLYSQLFETLYYEGNKKLEEGKVLEREVRFLLDEFVNIGQIPQFTKKLATMRKYGISCSIIIQNIAQLKPLYEDWETIIGNCDSMIFLGGLEYSTLEYISNILGTQTIRTRSEGRSRGKSGSSSLNYQKTQRKLLNPDEVGNIPNSDCIIKIRSLDPFFSKKYDYPTHPNYKRTGDANEANLYKLDIDNSNITASLNQNEDKSELVAATKRRRQLIKESINDSSLIVRMSSINEFLDKYNLDNAAQIFNRFTVVAGEPEISDEERKQIKQDLIKEILAIAGNPPYDEIKESVKTEYQRRKQSSDSSSYIPIEDLYEDKITEELPDTVDAFTQAFFASN